MPGSNEWIECFPSYTSSGLSFGQLAPEYFTYSIDNANCILYITGQQEYNGGKAGTLTCTASNNASTKKVIEVFCEYTPELYVYECKDDDLTNFEQKYTKLNALDGIAQTESDKKFEKRKFIVKYYPSNMDFNVTSSNTEVCEITERNDTFFTDKEGKTYALITVSPKKEGSAMLNVKVNIPYLPDKNKVVDVPYKLSYSDKYITDNTEIVPIISSGQFSNNGSSGKVDQINLGDGESLSYSIRVKDSMIALEDVHMAYVCNNSTKDKNTQLYIKDTPTSINNIYSSSDFASYYSDELFDTTKLNKIFGDSRKINDKYVIGNKSVYCKAEYDKTGLSNSDYYSSLKGLIYLQKDTFGSENYLFTLGHGFDYYKRIPNYNKTRWDIDYLDQFVSNGYNMVDTFLAEKDMIFRDDNNNLYNTVKHMNNKYFTKRNVVSSTWKTNPFKLYYGYIVEEGLLDWDVEHAYYGFGTDLLYNNQLINKLDWKKNVYEKDIKYDKYFYYENTSPYTISYNEMNTYYINKPLLDKVSIYNESLFHYNNVSPDDNIPNSNILGTIKYHWRLNDDYWDKKGHERCYEGRDEITANETNPIMYHEHLVPTVTKDTTTIKTFSGNDMGKVYFVVFHNGKKTVINTNGTSVNLVIRNCEAYQSGLWEKETIDSDTSHWISKVPQKEDIAALQNFYKGLIVNKSDSNIVTLPKGAKVLSTNHSSKSGDNLIFNSTFYDYSMDIKSITILEGISEGSISGTISSPSNVTYYKTTTERRTNNMKYSISFNINGVIVNTDISFNINDSYKIIKCPKQCDEVIESSSTHGKTRYWMEWEEWEEW